MAIGIGYPEGNGYPQSTTGNTGSSPVGGPAIPVSNAVTLPLLQSAYNSGTPTQQAQFQASVSVGQFGRKLRLATFGNSIAVATSVYAPTSLSPMVGVIPASGITQYSTDGIGLGMLPLYPNATAVANGGIAGQTLAQMVARDALAYSSSRKAITDVLAENPDMVITHLAINTLRTLTAGNYASVMAQAKADTRTLLARLCNGRALIVDVGCIGNDGAGSADAAQTKIGMLEYNAWLQSACVPEFGPYGYIYCPLAGISYDAATGVCLPNISDDGTHPNGYGQQVIGRVQRAAIIKYFGQPLQGAFGRNYIANAEMANTTANAWGVTATGFTVTAANGTKSNSQVAIIDGRITQSIEARGMGAWQQVTFAVPCDLTAAAVGMTADMAPTAADLLRMECDVFVESLDSAPVAFNLIAIVIEITGISGGTIYISNSVTTTAATPAGTTKLAFHLATPDVTAVAQAAIVSSKAHIDFYTNASCPNIRVGASRIKISKN
jgi:hypothetical protein